MSTCLDLTEYYLVVRVLVAVAHRRLRISSSVASRVADDSPCQQAHRLA
jgi:hypothetical protein